MKGRFGGGWIGGCGKAFGNCWDMERLRFSQLLEIERQSTFLNARLGVLGGSRDGS